MTSQDWRMLIRLHQTVVILVAAAYLWILRDQALPWPLLWAAGIAVVAATPVSPAFGIAAYAAILYGTPRYSVLLAALVRTHVLDWVVLFTATGTAIWRARSVQQEQGHSQRVLLGVGVMFFGWIALAWAVALASDTLPVVADVGHPTLLMFHAFVLMLVAAKAMKTTAAGQVVTLFLCAGLTVRVLWQGVAGIELEGDIGPLVLIALPLALATAGGTARWPQKVVMVALLLGGLGTIAFTYNRGTAVTFVAVSMLAMWHLRRHARAVVAALLVVGAAAGWAMTTPFAARFAAAWAELQGTATGSVTERFHLWQGGAAMVSRHPILGVGPGRYSAEIDRYDAGLHGMVAHNSYVQIAAETGWPGLFLYVGLFATALGVAGWVAWRASGRATGDIARAIQVSVVAYLVAGLFISRHDMVLAYVLVGWLAALSPHATRHAPAEHHVVALT